MRIAIITRNMQAGGAERVIAQLLKEWTDSGVQCSLYCMDPADPFYAIPENVVCHGVPSFCENTNADKIRKYVYLRKMLRQERPELVLSLPEEIGIYAALSLFGTGIPVVVSERNNPWVMPDKKITRLLRRLVYPFVDGLIFQTQKAASFFPASQQKKGVVLPNPLDLSRLPQPFEGIREKTVVSGGRLENQKNFQLLIRAFARFHQTHPNHTLVIYGEGKQRKQLETLARQLLPEGSWSLPGRVEDLPHRISRCEIFALSSDYEGVPNVLIEALAVGTPCISTDCAPGGAAELIRHEENGLLVPAGDEEALAQGLCRLADDPHLAVAIAKHGYDIRQKLDSRVVAGQWLRYLDQYVGK